MGEWGEGVTSSYQSFSWIGTRTPIVFGIVRVYPYVVVLAGSVDTA